MALAFTSKKRLKLQPLIDFGGRYIYHDSHEKTDYNSICSDHMDGTMRQFLFKMATIAGAFSIASISPYIGYLSTGTRTTTTETRIPFTEPKSNEEFIGNFIIQSIITLHGGPSYVGLECFLSLLGNVVTVVPPLIKSEFAQTIELYERKSISELELRIRIGNIVK